MKVLVLGGGGREHALVWKLRQSPRITQLVCAPGNGGIADDAEVAPADLKSLDSIVSLANRLQPDLTVVGPELPLTLGVVDEFTRRGWPIFGPTQAASRLELSKSFAKEFLQRHHIPTAHFAICDSMDQVRSALGHFHTPVVVKADGLAAGKGVVIARSKEEAASTAAEMLSGRMVGDAGARVVLEECLQGDELSFLVFSDGERVAPLVAAQDHKRVGDGDTGPNTGGMGAYSTPDLLDERHARLAAESRCASSCRGNEGRGHGIQRRPLLRPDDDRPRAHGARVQLPLRRSRNPTDPHAPRERPGRSIRGFHPRPYQRGRFPLVAGRVGLRRDVVRRLSRNFEAGKRIDGLDDAARIEGVKVFHAGTSKRGGVHYTSGGRVLGVTARAADLQTAVKRAYEACGKISFEGAHYRKDIAARALKG
jgi:phosphoribosylamine--glycine ligase